MVLSSLSLYYSIQIIVHFRGRISVRSAEGQESKDALCGTASGYLTSLGGLLVECPPREVLRPGHTNDFDSGTNCFTALRSAFWGEDICVFRIDASHRTR